MELPRFTVRRVMQFACVVFTVTSLLLAYAGVRLSIPPLISTGCFFAAGGILTFVGIRKTIRNAKLGRKDIFALIQSKIN